MEQNLLHMRLDARFSSDITRMKRKLLYILIASIMASVVAVVITFNNVSWLDANLNVKSNTTLAISLNTVALALNIFYIPFSFYCIPITLSLAWLMYLLSATAKLRLQQLRLDFMQWNTPVEDVIHHFHTMYSVAVRETSAKLKWLFIFHNVIMAVLAPGLFYLCLENEKKKFTVHNAIFLVWFIETLIGWMAPLYFAESLRSNEDLFKTDINNICPGCVEGLLPMNDEQELDLNERTFRSRIEINKFLTYLKERQSGFIIGYYEIQLRISMWSFYLGVMVFLLKILA